MDKRWYAALQRIVQKGPWGYETNGQVCRHALYRHFEFLDGLDPGVMVGTKADIDMVRQVVQQADDIAAMARLIQKMEDTVSSLMSLHLRGPAVRAAYKAKKLAMRFDDANLKNYFLKQLQTKFGYLFKSPTEGGVDLTAIAEDAEIEQDEIELHETYDWD